MSIKKKAITILSVAMALGAPVSGALASGAVYGSLNVTYHYVPVLKDKAVANTSCDIFDNSPTGNDTMWTKTTVTAYNGNNESVTDTRWNYNTAAMEGWNGAEAEIRNIQRANGEHRGGSDNCSAITYTSWTR